jgi:hypothetical protein
MHDALLPHRSLPRGRDRLRQALEPIADSDQHIFNAPVLQLGEDLQPEPGTLAAVAAQMPRISRSPFTVAPMTT